MEESNANDPRESPSQGREVKQRLRESIWDRLAEQRLARFPFPPHGRIPNFAGAAEAAKRLFELPLLAGATRIKVNPDAPQRYVRIAALERGIEVYVPTPRLKGGFKRFDPKRIPKEALKEAASLSKGHRWAEDVPLDELPRFDLLVVGSVAVSADGGRCGKGEGYADLEYGILRSLGHPEVPVVTTVHDIQIVPDLMPDAWDLPLAAIVTPTQSVFVRSERASGPSGIDWSRIRSEDLAEMPVLQDLRERLERERGRRST